MSFLWPQALLLLALIPLGAVIYRALGRRQQGRLAAFGASSTVSSATGTHRLRRRIPLLLFVLGLLVIGVALARPQGVIDLPREEGTVILAFDVSGSMAATDLTPTRMEAAKAAARDFIEREPPSVAIGVVAFSDAGVAVQQPSNDQATALAAIERLAPQHGTSLGQGILASLKAIAVAAAPPSVDYYSSRSPAPTPSPTPVPVGTHAPALVVLLSDGENNESPDPLAAARAAADQGVRIYTVGIGSAAGTTLQLDGFQVHTQLDAPTLQQIAQITGGTYYAAGDAQSLAAVYDDLDPQLIVKPEQIELTAVFAGASVLVLSIGALCSLVWLGRLP
ncbi:MAG: VWA domain-containing protein [Candidatus Limnocylindrales bacterium]